ncbi:MULTISPECIES: anti-CBASS protein Acb1 family protein [Borreliella]|uniref:anti-CBASS protein Acb1 family protein n=3 Tax=Borreliella TaxID=64895 RepID=UPI00016B2D8F|nr:anti-CBASS Acb1 family protein [Borreliella garinii]ACJ73326.1 putative phage portal protein, HI1409 family protein [Borreliella afzelii ACA-1]
MFRLNFLKRPIEKKLFPVSEYIPHQDSLRLAHQIAEIYAGFASSRDIEHKIGDGLSKLFDNNFRAIIKKMVYKAILSGESHFYIVVPDSDDPKKPLKKGFPCLCYNFGEVVESNSFFLKNIHESRVISMKSTFMNFEALKKSSNIMETLLNETVGFLKVNNFTFLKSATLPSVKDMTAYDLAEVKKNIDGVLDSNHKMMILGREDDIANVTRSVSPLRDAFEIIVSDITLHSGIPKEILYPVSPSGEGSVGNYDIFYLNIEQICKLMVTPFINSVLFKFGLESNWCYKPVKPISQKEQAEIDEKHVKTLATYVDLLEKAKDMGNDDLYLKIQSDMNEYLQI